MIDGKYEILVIGVGSIGERHVRCFQNTDRVVVAVCDCNKELLQTVAERYGISRTYTDWKQALKSSEFDATVIATPAHLHVHMAIRAATAGCHMLIEKPLSTKLDQIETLLSRIQGNNVVASVGYVMRAHPSLAAMREAIRNGRIGKPVQIYATSGQHFPKYRPAYRDIYYRDHATGGGAIQDSLTHLFNAVQWILGPVDCLVADARHQMLDGVDVEDTVNILARHGDVLVGYCHNLHQAPNESMLTVVGQQGTARFESHNARWRWMLNPDTAWQEEVLDSFHRDQMFVSQANAFLDAVENKRKPLCSVHEAFQTLQANLAAIESLENTSKWTQIKEFLP